MTDLDTMKADMAVLALKAGDTLSFAAQTSGGTAGRDEALVAAIAGWEAARKALKAHHDWHLVQEEDADGVGGSDAYAESALCDQTLAALSARLADAEQPAVAGDGGLRDALEWYADQFCEYGGCIEGCGKYDDGTCAGCRARAALSTSVPAGVVGEPVAWRCRHSEQENWYVFDHPKGWWECQPLYARTQDPTR